MLELGISRLARNQRSKDMKTSNARIPSVELPVDKQPKLAFIWSVNLDKVVRKLKKDHWSWSLAKIDRLMIEYRRFLTLNLIYGQPVSVTSKVLDEVWHTHILFTSDYSDFCEKAFGQFLHHCPIMDTSDLPASADRFFEHYEATFGIPAPSHYRSWWFFNKALRLCVSTGFDREPTQLCVSTGCHEKIAPDT